MATDPPRPNGNGERLSLQLGTKSFGITARDLIPVLLILGGIVGGYLLYTNVYAGLGRLAAHQEAIDATLRANQLKMVETLAALEKDLGEHRLAIQELLTGQRRTIQKLLETHDYNSGRPPQERLPLDVELGGMPPKQELR